MGYRVDQFKVLALIIPALGGRKNDHRMAVMTIDEHFDIHAEGGRVPLFVFFFQMGMLVRGIMYEKKLKNAYALFALKIVRASSPIPKTIFKTLKE